MKTISKLLLLAVLGLSLPGCASHPATKPTDSRLEAPAETDSDVHTEVHGSISTSVGATFK